MPVDKMIDVSRNLLIPGKGAQTIAEFATGDACHLLLDALPAGQPAALHAGNLFVQFRFIAGFAQGIV